MNWLYDDLVDWIDRTKDIFDENLEIPDVVELTIFN